ncbi:MAG: two-component system, NarL family, sensor histidine kinase DegS [Clostridiales bacterium]|jgi:two-component system sensor histidine kinase DegS|nr:two-component system, NarL family, sensor histidine kinase DegS [Clostridiales bacterium]MDK2902235.1 two-component system, NarL family, sensor histidine kinase DegS [Clostridiales bacterium]MDK2991288.1 two-component system, NarL family, sensor histidine kinase DegS [Clostridiales bacterium]
MVDVGQLDYILKNVVNTIKQSQQQINDISEEALKEWNELQQRLVDIQCQIRLIIDEVDSLDKLLHRSRQRLAEVSKNFQIFSEEDIKAAYDEASELQLKLALKRQLEKQLQEQRKDIEQRVKRVKDTLEKADRISSQISAALALITSDLNDIANELQDMQFKEFMNNRIIMAQEEERQRLARDIHDGPAQSMSNLLLKAELCDRLLDTDVRAAHNELSELKNMIRNSLSEIRKVIFDLRPMSLDDLGLIPTLVQYVEDFEKESGMTVDLKIKGNHTVALKSIVEVAVFRVIQEALNNVRKHSHAKNVLIYLEFLDKVLNIRINDDGVGFDSKAILKTEEREHAAGFGLYSMKERVTLLNGKFDIITSPGEGTTIFASIPMEREHKTNG